MVQFDLQNTMAARTLLIRESKSKAKECKLVSLRTLKGHPTADLDHASHRDIYPYHNLLMRVMSTVTGKMADSVPSGFLLISHKLLPHFAWILVGIQIHKSSNYWPNFSSNGHHLAIHTIHFPKLLCSEFAATNLIKHLSNPMFYSPNSQTKWRHWCVLSKEWDYQVWGQSNLVCVTNRRLEDKWFSATKLDRFLVLLFLCFTHCGVCFALSDLSHRSSNFSFWGWG